MDVHFFKKKIHQMLFCSTAIKPELLESEMKTLRNSVEIKGMIP